MEIKIRLNKKKFKCAAEIKELIKSATNRICNDMNDHVNIDGMLTISFSNVIHDDNDNEVGNWMVEKHPEFKGVNTK